MATHRITSPAGRIVYEFDSKARVLTHTTISGTVQSVTLIEEDAAALDIIQTALMESTMADEDGLLAASMNAYDVYFKLGA